MVKIKFNSDDDLIIRSVFEEGGKLHPHFFQVCVCMSYKNVTVQKI